MRKEGEDFRNKLRNECTHYFEVCRYLRVLKSFQEIMYFYKKNPPQYFLKPGTYVDNRAMINHALVS